MGAWGVGVFSDDLALDIRGEWRDALLRREEPVDASRRIAGRTSAVRRRVARPESAGVRS